MAEEKTIITSVNDSELASLLAMGDAQNVITDDSSAGSLFKRDDDPEVSLVVKKNEVVEKREIVSETDEKLLNPLTLVETEVDEEKIKKELKDETLDALEYLVKEDVIFLFEGDKPLKEYTKKEQAELIKANLDRIKEEADEKAPAEFFDSIPESLKYAAKYHADGGTDLKSIYKFLAENEEIKEFDITTEDGQEKTIRSYLKMNGDMTPQEIEEELNSLKDLPGALEKKAKLYKPKLDSKQQQLIEKQVKEQETRRLQHEQAAINYRETVLNALSVGDLEGIKITPSIQNMLFEGLTKSNYPSVSGRNTNLLGHLLEQNNYVKPNPVLISKVLWLLKDSKGFEEAIKASVNKELVTETVKKLKTASNEKVVNTNQVTNVPKVVQRTLANPKKNIFSRQ